MELLSFVVAAGCASSLALMVHGAWLCIEHCLLDGREGRASAAATTVEQPGPLAKHAG